MKEDLREVLPLWSLDRRGDGPHGTATISETVGVLYAFGCTGPLGEPLEMVDDRPARLWYYTPGAVSYYLQLNTSDEERRGMTKDTNGQFPFDGDLGRGFEQFYHEWRIYPISDIVVQDTNEHQSDSSLKLSLEGMENSIYKSWEEIANVESHFAAGGGSVVGPLVQAFVKHIYDLADTPGHAYYIYQHDEDDN